MSQRRVRLLALGLTLSACARTAYVPVELNQARVPQVLAAATLDDADARAVFERYDAGAGWPPAAWTPMQLGLLAASRSHAVAAAQADVAAAIAERAVAAQGPHSGIAIALEHHSDDSGEDSNWSIGPSFEYLWSPVSRTRIRVALADVAIVSARAAVLEAAWRARTVAVTAALDLRAEQRHHVLLEREGQAREAALAAARAQLAAGLADSFEWHSLQLEANSARLNRLDRVTALASAGATLAAALELPLAALRELRLADPTVVAVPDYALLQQRALARHPRVLTALAAYDKAERDLELAVAAQYPEVRLSPGYFFDQGDNVWSLVGGVVVPLFAGHDAAIQSAAAARDAARDQFEAVQAGTIAELQSAYELWRATDAALGEARAVQSEVEQSYQALRMRQEQGVIDRLTVARAELQLGTLALQVADIEARAWQALFGMEQAARATLFDDAFEGYLAAAYGAGVSAE